MQTVWNLGNTTVRNPNRIEQGLRVFADGFQGRLHEKSEQNEFAHKLIDEGIVLSEGESQDWLGRKWRSAFKKLGFATNSEYALYNFHLSAIDFARNNRILHLQGLEYELTPAGRNLLSATTTAAIQDVYLRQLIRHEIPSPIESGFPEGRLKPFIFLLQVLTALYQLGQPGINKMETALFIQPFQNHSAELVHDTVQQIIRYRELRRAQDGIVAKKNYDSQLLQSVKQQIDGPLTSTFLDYADTTFRYSQMSGLLTMHGDSIVIKPDKNAIVTAILQNEPQFLVGDSPEQYLVEFYRGSALPTDNVAFALTEIERLENQIREFDIVPISQNMQISRGDIHEIEQQRYSLLEQLSRLRENQFAAGQTERESINEILEYLDVLSGNRRGNELNIVDRATFLEWSVWRGFLAIDHITIPIHETRRFPIDDELMPRHPAPGGGSDMIFEFEDFILLVEVTLTTSSRQLSAEGEPVRRHVANVKEEANKDVYCLFIAPSIDNNTAETFRIGVWYRGDNEENLNIVPVTLSQFTSIIRLLLTIKFTPAQLRLLLDRCLTYRNARAPEWKRMIERSTISWCEQAINP